MIRFDQTICTDFAAATRREWLETNGLGGFASGTVAGAHTRRYHGLLVAALHPPVGRTALLAKLEETLVIDGARYELSANQYPNAIHPQGYQYLKEFRLDPWPVWVYEVAGHVIQKSVFMVDGENSTVVRYALLSSNGQTVELEARPLLAFRDYHALMHETGAVNAHYISAEGLLSFTPYVGLPALHLAHNAVAAEPAGYWYRNFEYAVERARGLDDQEDLFNPCALKFALVANQSADLIASTEARDIKQVAQFQQAEFARRQAVVAGIPAEDELTRTLTAAADQFIVKRGAGHTIIAGYPWFSDWGRDTMIALPGLTLTTGRTDIAASILKEFAQHVNQGMLPNRFPDAGEAPEYNTVDATLWYVEAIRAWLAVTPRATKDAAFVKEQLYATLTDIIDWHERGTRYGIRVDDDGLLSAGEPGVQLTWMDAKVGDWVVTPRIGKPVEIQALWFNALCVMRDLAEGFGDTTNAKRFKQMAARAKRSFNEQLWNDAASCLFDVIDGDERDGSIRPNQIFAVSLPHGMLTKARAKQVVAVVERDLLTPYGLRSLAPDDAHYCAHYAGSVIERDGAYHQGTVWAWLLGPFITAYLKVNSGAAASAQVAQWRQGLAEHLLDAGLGQVAEVFDGDAPHQPGGCIAQAWSVAEWLRSAAA